MPVKQRRSPLEMQMDILDTFSGNDKMTLYIMWRTGMSYDALRKQTQALISKGLVIESLHNGKRPKRTYIITPKGFEALQKWRALQSLINGHPYEDSF